MKNRFINTIAINRFLLCLFISVSFFVKFYQLGYRSFFQDELYSVSAASEPDYRLFLENWVLYDSNPPLYYFFLRLWLKIAPATEFWVRLPSVLFVLAASFIFIKGIKKRFQELEWFYLLIFIGTSYGFLFFAQEARSYALLLLFTGLQLLYFIDLLLPKPIDQGKFTFNLAVFSIFSVLSSYTHYTGIVFSGILFFILIVLYIRQQALLKKIFAAIFLSLCSGLFWISNFLFFFNLDKSFIIHQKASIIKNIVPMLFFGNSVIGKCFSILAFLAFIILVFLFSKKWSLASNIQRAIIGLGLLSCLIILVSPFLSYFFSYRHYVVFIPVILLSFSILLSQFLPVSESGKSIIMIFGIVILFAQGATHYKSKREEWRQAVEFAVKINQNQKAKVIVLGEPWNKSQKEYLLANEGNLNLSVRRKKYYQHYFDQYDTNHKLDLIVLRPNKKLVENYINTEMKFVNQIFILSYTAGFSKDIDMPALDFTVFKKEFYGQTVYVVCKKTK